MSQLLILGTGILAIGPLVDTGNAIQCPDIIYPKTTIPGYEIQDVVLPSDFTIQTYRWVAWALQKIVEPTPPPIFNEPIITESFNASLKRKAVKLEAQGQTFEAVQLLLQAQGVKS
jgi:hypothetical protein